MATMQKELTTRDFWTNYWNSKDAIKIINHDFSFHGIFREYLTGKPYHAMIEVGGYPGHYAVFFRKFWHLKTTILDYVIKPQIISRLAKVNGLTIKDLDIIKSDFFTYQSRKKYDVVFSLGFIEHFDDTAEVIRRHWNLVSTDGTAIIGIPNFLGLNGIYRLVFDPSNLNIHNLDAMNISSLTNIVRSLKPKKFKIFYVSGGMVWLEKLSQRNILLQILTYGINLIGFGLTRLGIKNKFISTHIFIIMGK